MRGIMDTEAATRRAPPLTPAAPPQRFASADDRARLSATAVSAVKKIAQFWHLTTTESASLLGMSESTWERSKRGSRQEPLTQDQLTRASAIIGIFKGLRLLFADDMADRWIRLPNRNPLFEGKTPVAAMIEGGIPLLLDVRRYIDAVRGGL